MEVLLGLIIILSPVFVIVSLWTGLSKKTRVKITNTCISALFIAVAIAMGANYTELEKSEKTVSYAVGRDMKYIECLDRNESFDNKIDNCIIPNVQLLRKTYDM